MKDAEPGDMFFMIVGNTARAVLAGRRTLILAVAWNENGAPCI